MCDTIGIDLGTTFCSCAYFIDNKVDCTEFDTGKKILPSVVEYGNKIIVGEAAYSNISSGKPNICYDSKRYIGRKFVDIDKEYIKNCNYTLESKDDKPHFKLQDGSLKTPVEVSSEVLKEIFRNAKEKITGGNNIRNAVITVPAYFKTFEREETRRAGEMAGLNVLQLINEPTAAAIAYIYENNVVNGQSLIYDFGGGTFDVSIVDVKGNNMNVLMTQGDDRLGGQDLTNKLLNYILEEAKKEDFSIEKDTPKGIRKLAQLRKKIDEVKVSLSTSSEEDVEVNDDISIELSRSKFEEVCQEFFDKTIKIVDDTINKLQNSFNSINNVNKNKNLKVDIKRIILIGGSSKIPKIEEMLKSKYNVPILKSINPNEAVALGAAYFANSIRNTDAKFIIHDILNTSVGIEGVENGNHIFIPILNKGQTLPCEESSDFQVQPYCSDVIIRVYEGNDKDLSYDKNIGDFTIDFGQKSEPTIVNVTYRSNSDGILDIEVKLDGIKKNYTISYNQPSGKVLIK